MLGLMLMLAVQSAAEVTPAITSFTLSTGTAGTCITTPLQPATIRLDWTVTGYNSTTYDVKIYRDGVLVNTQDASPYSLQIAGLVEGNNHNPQDITFNYRIDIARASDGAVVATQSLSVTKHYGNCA